jgi:hypothetical protein
MATLKRRIEQLEERHARKLIEATDRYLKGRSFEDVDFFCIHGYLPDVPIPGTPYNPAPLSWKERWRQWREQGRIMASRTTEECEFFCIHGAWPGRAKDQDLATIKTNDYQQQKHSSANDHESLEAGENAAEADWR